VRKRGDGERISIDVPRASLGHDEDLSPVRPAKGEWTSTLQIRTSDIHSCTVEQRFSVT
jgi:hypothetical protein